jgi:hypothetical protein
MIGPAVTIVPITPNAHGRGNIFSKGVGYMVTSGLEILFQILKDDLPDMTQGQLRSYVNRVMNQTVLRYGLYV